MPERISFNPDEINALNIQREHDAEQAAQTSGEHPLKDDKEIFDAVDKSLKGMGSDADDKLKSGKMHALLPGEMDFDILKSNYDSNKKLEDKFGIKKP